MMLDRRVSTVRARGHGLAGAPHKFHLMPERFEVRRSTFGYRVDEDMREGGSVTRDDRTGGEGQRRSEQTSEKTPCWSWDSSTSKVARVEDWEPFDQVDRFELDDH